MDCWDSILNCELGLKPGDLYESFYKFIIRKEKTKYPPFLPILNPNNKEEKSSKLEKI